MNVIEIIVEGPVVPKARARITRNGAFTPDRSAEYEARVAWCAKAAMRGRPHLSGPLTARIHVELPVPRTWPKWKRDQALSRQLLPISTADLDNYVKATLDALNGVVYRDDAAVVSLHATKEYGPDPLTVVLLTELGRTTS